jgi:tRNA/tmRNA/rRNA uracil-C5-methylase (TrmA/RlmC/RlmD family)
VSHATCKWWWSAARKAPQVVIVANSATADALGRVLRFDPRAARLRAAQLVVQRQLRARQHHPRSDFQNWCGPASVVERFGGAAVHYPPGAFGQNNLDIAQDIIEHVRAQIPQGARVAEFYAGVGAIGLSVLARVREIRLNEVNPHSLHGLELGLAQLDPAVRAKITVVPGTAGAACLAASGAQVVIADPPRKGLDPELTEYLSEHPPERFVYVSCGLESLSSTTPRA